MKYVYVLGFPTILLEASSEIHIIQVLLALRSRDGKDGLWEWNRVSIYFRYFERSVWAEFPLPHLRSSKI